MTVVHYILGFALGAATVTLIRYLGLKKQTTKSPSSSYSFPTSEEFKLVMCVRSDLKMKKGKIAAQCGHAVSGIMSQESVQPLLKHWRHRGEAKVALSVSTEEELLALKEKAKALDLPTYTVVDAGRTQIAPNSVTVLGIGPGPVSVIDSVTQHLKLL
ncbi:hypothetical protein GEMRC1_009251 [Eukaryota sp. GEM-RC1]